MFSAGIGDVVLAALRHEKLLYTNIHVISNFLNYDGNQINGFKGNIIHIFNKNEHAVENTSYFQVFKLFSEIAMKNMNTE